MLVLLQKVQRQQLTAAAVNNINAGGTKMICNGTANEAMDTAYDKQNKLHHSHSLVSIKPTKQPDHTQELGDGVTAKFVSFNLDDHDDDDDTSNESIQEVQYGDPPKTISATLKSGIVWCGQW